MGARLDTAVSQQDNDSLAGYPQLPPGWTRRSSAALLLTGCGLQADSSVDLNKIAGKLVSLDKSQPIEIKAALEIARTAGKYLRECVLNEPKNLLAIMTHAHLVMQVDESTTYGRLQPAMEQFALEYGTHPEVNELVVNTAYQLWITAPARIGFRSQYAASRMSGFGLVIDRLIDQTNQAVKRRVHVPIHALLHAYPEYQGTISGYVAVHIDNIVAASEIRPFTHGEFLLDLEKDRYLQTSHAFYSLRDGRAILMADVAAYECRGFFSSKAIFSLKTGERFVVKGLVAPPGPKIVSAYIDTAAQRT